MAVTKIKRIHKTINKSIDYITNKNKTDDQVLVDSFNCSPATAALEFAMTSKFSAGSENKKQVLGYHIIQSFAPGETTPEIAYEIGKKLADKFTEGKYEYVLATHIDKNHIHNHIIMNSVSFVDHKKYHSKEYPYRKIREISDELCMEYNLSVISKPGRHGKSYNKWLAENGFSKAIKFDHVSKVKMSSLPDTLAHDSYVPGLEKYKSKNNIKQLNKTYIFMEKNKLSDINELNSYIEKSGLQVKQLKAKISAIESDMMSAISSSEYESLSEKLDALYEEYYVAKNDLFTAKSSRNTLEKLNIFSKNKTQDWDR